MIESTPDFKGEIEENMGGQLYKILFVLAMILVDISSSNFNRFSDNTYDDSIWTLSRNYREGNEYEDSQSKSKNVEERIDIKMPMVAPQKVQYTGKYNCEIFTVQMYREVSKRDQEFPDTTAGFFIQLSNVEGLVLFEAIKFKKIKN